MGGGEKANVGLRDTAPFAVLKVLAGGATAGGRCDELDEGVGTCWKARVTSYAVILVQGPGPDGGGVVPSSDFTSCSEKEGMSSAMPLRELTG